MRTFSTGIIDTCIGFRLDKPIAMAAMRLTEEGSQPHGYMFNDIPAKRRAVDDPMASVDETLRYMDQYGIEYGLISLTDERTPEALRRHPKRFVAGIAVDGNKGMDAVRAIVRAKDEHDIRCVYIVPSGVSPQIPINDKLWYPVYAKCIELDLVAFVATGVPGPRVKMMAQYPGHLDEVCYDFPELKLVMRHGAEPWEELAVKLLLKWPNLYYSTSGFAPKYYPKAIIDFANSRGADKVLYAGYYPFGLELERIFRELDQLPLKDEVWPKFLSGNARKLLKLPT